MANGRRELGFSVRHGGSTFEIYSPDIGTRPSDYRTALAKMIQMLTPKAEKSEGYRKLLAEVQRA